MALGECCSSADTYLSVFIDSVPGNNHLCMYSHEACATLGSSIQNVTCGNDTLGLKSANIAQQCNAQDDDEGNNQTDRNSPICREPDDHVFVEGSTTYSIPIRSELGHRFRELVFWEEKEM